MCRVLLHSSACEVFEESRDRVLHLLNAPTATWSSALLMLRRQQELCEVQLRQIVNRSPLSPPLLR